VEAAMGEQILSKRQSAGFSYFYDGRVVTTWIFYKQKDEQMWE